MKEEPEYQPSGSESDIEETIGEEERLEAEGEAQDYAAELQDLEDETKLSVEELRSKYSQAVKDSESK